MRAPDLQPQKMFFYVSCEKRIPKSHPLRPVKAMAEECLHDSDERFNRMYSSIGRPSIAPERLLKNLLLQALCSIRSERAFIDHIDFNTLFRWFVGLHLDESLWNQSTFSKNRDRLIDSDIALSFLEILARAKAEGLLASDYFFVDGTRLEAWTSLKGLRPKKSPPNSLDPTAEGSNPEVDFHEQRSNVTHASTTDPETPWPKRAEANKPSSPKPATCSMKTIKPTTTNRLKNPLAQIDHSRAAPQAPDCNE